MKVVLYYIYLLPLLLSAMFSLKVFRLNWPKPYRGFSLFLLATLVIELFALFWKYKLHTSFGISYSSNNLWIYNLYLLPQYLFYIYFFSKTSEAGKIKSLSPLIAIGYGLISCVNLFYLQGLYMVNYLTITLSNLIVIFYVVAYFIQLMQAETVVKLSTQPKVWLSIGAFIFHLGSTPCFILLNYISYENRVLALSLFRIIIGLNTLMYLSYLIAFLCTRKYPMSPSSH